MRSASVKQVKCLCRNTNLISFGKEEASVLPTRARSHWKVLQKWETSRKDLFCPAFSCCTSQTHPLHLCGTTFISISSCSQSSWTSQKVILKESSSARREGVALSKLSGIFWSLRSRCEHEDILCCHCVGLQCLYLRGKCIYILITLWEINVNSW